MFVLNGNGRNGAASAAASRLSDLGYRVAGHRKREAAGLRDDRRHVQARLPAPRASASRTTCTSKVVGPLDGIDPSTLHGAQLAIVLGAR